MHWPSSAVALEMLCGRNAVRLDALPQAFGIYALRDHTGALRYIGSTPKLSEGFRTRIFSKHATGSEGRSHKYSQAYCSGRMWRFCNKLHPTEAGTLEFQSDAIEAKRVRNKFIRTYCSASLVEIDCGVLKSTEYACRLVSLELEIQQLATDGMRDWEGIHFPAEPEPTVLLDTLLQSFPASADALSRQKLIWDGLPN